VSYEVSTTEDLIPETGGYVVGMPVLTVTNFEVTATEQSSAGTPKREYHFGWRMLKVQSVFSFSLPGIANL
jgi:hypothetical protein